MERQNLFTGKEVKELISFVLKEYSKNLITGLKLYTDDDIIFEVIKKSTKNFITMLLEDMKD